MHEFDKITLARRANKCDWRLDGKNQCEIDQVQKLAYFLLEEIPTDVNGLLPHERAHLTERMKEFIKPEAFATGEGGQAGAMPPPPPPQPPPPWTLARFGSCGAAGAGHARSIRFYGARSRRGDLYSAGTCSPATTG